MSYPELGPLAAAVGVPHAGEAQIRFLLRGATMVVSLELNSGSVCGVNVRAERSGLPDVTLRREDDEDRKGKARGLNVEAQTHDPLFDWNVYIETDLPEAAVRHLFAAAELRAAVVQLLAWGDEVRLSPSGIDVTASSRPGLFEPASLQPHLVAVASLARLPGIPVPWNVVMPRSGLAMLILLGFAAPAAIAALVLSLVTWTPLRLWLPFAGIGAGLVAFFLLRPVVFWIVRGHSRSHHYYFVGQILWFLTLPAAGGAIAAGLNGGLDTSEAQRVVATIVSVRHYKDDDDNGKTEAQVRWPDGSTSGHDFEDDHHQLRAGDPVISIRHKGYFGVSWEEGSTTAYSNTGGKVP